MFTAGTILMFVAAVFFVGTLAILMIAASDSPTGAMGMGGFLAAGWGIALIFGILGLILSVTGSIVG